MLFVSVEQISGYVLLVLVPFWLQLIISYKSNELRIAYTKQLLYP